MILMNIQGLFIEINTRVDEIKTRLRSDFEYFLVENYTHGPQLKISVDFTDITPLNFIPKNLRPLFQRHNSITYEENGVRYNDYYGSVLSVFEARKNTARVYGKDLDKLYEVVYLMILSRSGKHGDLKGTHKIHAFAVVKNFTGLICMQPMRGGKSTLFTELMLHHDVEVVSDDTPLINTRGELLPFPLRVSLDKVPEQLNLDEGLFYLMKREFYKAKFSISLKAFKRPIAAKTNYYIFTEAHRSTHDQPFIKKMSPLKLFRSLFKHMVIGVGLPVIFEYFWESGPEDFIRKTIIFLRRFSLALRLSLKYRGYDVYLTDDKEKNAKVLINLIS